MRRPPVLLDHHTPSSGLQQSHPKYFGRKRGVTWYNLVSDPGTLRNSMVILGLLLE